MLLNLVRYTFLVSVGRCAHHKRSTWRPIRETNVGGDAGAINGGDEVAIGVGMIYLEC